MVSIVLKAGEKWEYDRYGMLAVNYGACLIPFLISRAGQPLPSIDADLGFCALFACMNGFLYLAGMIMNQINVNRNGATLQSVFSRLGVMVPTGISIIFFGERPDAGQIIGILLVLAAFCVMNIPQKAVQKHTRPAVSLLLLGLLFNGLTDSMLKIFEVFGKRNLDDWFMGATFVSASLTCLIIMLAKKEKIGRREFITGLCLGIPNYLSSLLLLKSLSYIDAYIAYPTYSVGAILAVMTASFVFFKEKLSKWSMLSIIMILPAILLLNA